MESKNGFLGGGFKYVLFSTLIGEMTTVILFKWVETTNYIVCFVIREASSPDVSQTWMFFYLGTVELRTKALRELLWQPLLSVSIRQVALQQGGWGFRTCFFLVLGTGGCVDSVDIMWYHGQLVKLILCSVGWLNDTVLLPPTETYDIKIKWKMTHFRSCLPHAIPDQAWQDFFWPMMIWTGN